MPYIKFNKFTKEQRFAGVLRIKSIKAPIITIGVSGGEPENYGEISEKLVAEYTRIGGEGTIVRPNMGSKFIEFYRT